MFRLGRWRLVDAATCVCLPGELYLSYHFGGPACGYRRLRGAVSLLLTAASHPGEVSPLLGPLGLGPPLSEVRDQTEMV